MVNTPNTVTHEIEPLPTAVEEIADLARRDAQRQPESYDLHGDGDRSLVLIKLRQDERVETIDLEHRLDEPHRTRGNVMVHDPSDFAEYVNRIANIDHTTVWANIKTGVVTAVVNDHKHWDEAGWRDHTIGLHLQDDEDWVRWHTRNNQLTSQEDFAEFVEDVAHTIVTHDAATMLEVATTFSAKRSVDFAQGTRLQTGDIQLTCVETATAVAGAKSNIEVPERIRVRIAPWLGVEPVELDARLSWRIRDHRLAIGYQLLRSDIAKRDAFANLVMELRAQLDGSLPILLGVPPAPIHT